ncbi:hypothetical protein SAMN05216174_115142 [Actinokineospora iranica]|uniref:Uncharacterized protein n=1 Tax=Actinokineospora iranica TaxID=1271860 RepID=A0A1G6WRQ7_9PSEU|nr:hypothetical protein SAMN05216174_115142 [Actinokineospora iranica]
MSVIFLCPIVDWPMSHGKFVTHKLTITGKYRDKHTNPSSGVIDTDPRVLTNWCASGKRKQLYFVVAGHP